MQKFFIAIALALALTSAFAGYSTQNYVKPPVQAAADNETGFTNVSTLTLAAVTSGNVYLVSGNLTLNSNLSLSTWSLFYRQLNIKTLATSQNYNASITAPPVVFFYNNYVVGLKIDNESNMTNLRAYQAPLASGSTAPARLTLSNNSNSSYGVALLSYQIIGNVVYAAYGSAYLTASINSFTIGSSTTGTSFNLSTTFDTPNSLSITWGEALGSSQLFAVWTEAGILKDAIINVKGTVTTPTAVPGYNSANQTSCVAFATDAKLYGELCTGPSNPVGNTTYWVRTYGSGNNTLQLIASYNTSTASYSSFVPYGPYIAVFLVDASVALVSTYSYEIWALDTFNTTILKQRQQYLTINPSNSTQVPLRIVAGGYYTLLYNTAPNGIISSIYVGQLLGSSYLASVLGFLLTIVAGLLLF
jgi:hypothetical protein